jgi:hypothetical protein
MLELKKYERQNIKRRLNCNPIEYTEAYERQKGLCELCQESSTHFLKPDKYKHTKRLVLICDHCLHWSAIRVRDPKRITDRMLSYFELSEII